MGFIAGGEDTCQANDVVRASQVFSGGFKGVFTSSELMCQYIARLDNCLQKHLVQSLLICYDYYILS